MKNRKIVKIIVCIIMLLIFILYMQPSYASNIIKEAQEWFEGGKTGGETIMNPQDTANAIAPISQLLFWAGIITLFIAGFNSVELTLVVSINCPFIYCFFLVTRYSPFSPSVTTLSSVPA